MATGEAWKLQSFIDSLAGELDRTQDTLSVKALNRPLSYMVQDLAVDLSVFPSYDGREVRFRAAQPGEAGAATLRLKLGSISDRQVRETTRAPVTRDDVAIEDVEGLDDDTKDELHRLGVRSARDVDRFREKDIDLGSATKKKGLDYGTLANLIVKAKRKSVLPPRVQSLRLQKAPRGYTLSIGGENLFLTADPPFPLAAFDGRPASISKASASEIVVEIDPQSPQAEGQLQVALDPFAVLNLRVNR
jgi:hypothetical protein